MTREQMTGAQIGEIERLMREAVYLPGGDGPRAYDCWGLVAWVSRDVFGRVLPVLGGDRLDRAVVAAQIVALSASGGWRQVQGPLAGDLVSMRCAGEALHIGIWLDLDGGRVMHCMESRGCTAAGLAALRVEGWRLTYWRPLAVGGGGR